MPTLPRPRAALTISTFDRALAEATGKCDLQELTFIDAYGLVGIACALSATGTDRPRLLLPRSEATRSHMNAMGLLDYLTSAGFPDLPTAPLINAPDVVVPLRSASDSGGAQALSNLLWQQLREHVAPEVLNAMAEGVWEMIANALEHSGGDALIMGQVYRTPRGMPPDHADRVQVVIGDTGRGIRQSFLASGSHSPATELEAITMALEYLVTSVVDDPGRGQGLFTTAEHVVDTNGRMVVRSGDAKVSITAEGRTTEVVPFMPGVVVGLSLPLYP